MGGDRGAELQGLPVLHSLSGWGDQVAITDMSLMWGQGRRQKLGGSQREKLRSEGKRQGGQGSSWQSGGRWICVLFNSGLQGGFEEERGGVQSEQAAAVQLEGWAGCLGGCWWGVGFSRDP